jgi:hypothetical protein
VCNDDPASLVKRLDHVAVCGSHYAVLPATRASHRRIGPIELPANRTSSTTEVAGIFGASGQER